MDNFGYCLSVFVQTGLCLLNAQCLVIASEIFQNIANNHMGSGQISILLGTRHVIYQKLSSFVEKGYLC